MYRKIAIFGSTGFVGQELIKHFRKCGHEVIAFARSKKEGYGYWNPSTRKIELSLLEGVDLVINLAGEPIFGRWSAKKKKKIVKSRLEATDFLVEMLLQLESPPKLYIGASAIGYYGVECKDILTEKSEKGEGFLADLCERWEAKTDPLKKKMRLCHGRFGVVLGTSGGALRKLWPLFSLGLGGRLGSGRQCMSWVAIEDLTAAFDFLIAHQELEGVFNITSPHPITNSAFTRILASKFHRPAFFHIPSWLLFLLLGEGATPLLGSLSVLPERLLKEGFTFTYPDIEGLLKNKLLFNSQID